MDIPPDINNNLLWSVSVIGAIGGVAIKAVADIIIAFIRKSKNADEDIVSGQVSDLLKDSERYRKEIKNDLENMRTIMGEMENRHKDELSTLSNRYESELNQLRSEVTVLRDKITEYRRENGALHLLLRERGIEPPSWINSEK